MKAIAFDTGPFISLTLNNLLWLLEPLRQQFRGDFFITTEVYDELIRRPLSTHKYKFEALQILPLITKGIITVADAPAIEKNADELHRLANNCYLAHGNPISIVHRAEMQVVACALVKGCDAIVIDERTTRALIENPKALQNQLQRKLHTSIQANDKNLKLLQERIRHIKVIRSFELVTVSYELGLFDAFALKEEERVVPNIKHAILEGVLWGVKLAGCSVREEDIETVLNLEKTT